MCFPLSDWQNSKCLQFALLVRIKETNTTYSAAGKTHRATSAEGNVAIPVKLSMLLLFDLPAIPLLKFYPVSLPTYKMISRPGIHTALLMVTKKQVTPNMSILIFKPSKCIICFLK